jgi:glycosyltransferase involved in cell wall biosynthesis
MTGVADIYLIMLCQPQSKEARLRFWSLFDRKKKPEDLEKFVLLSWQRSGSNLLSGIFHLHPEIIMHNELFNQIDIFTYHPYALYNADGEKLCYLARDVDPPRFLDLIWSGSYHDGVKIKPGGKTVGFKSFPDHWKDVGNEHVWRKQILDNNKVKKVILSRECELSTFVSMKRAEKSGIYLGQSYPEDLKVTIDVAAFQAFVNNYRFTFQQKYRSPLHREDSFRITYEQLVDTDIFDDHIAPKLFEFIGVDPNHRVKRLEEVVKQSQENECLENVIDNWNKLERAFRHTDVSYFKKKTATRKIAVQVPGPEVSLSGLWSILLPICSRVVSSVHVKTSGADRFAEIEESSQHSNQNTENSNVCWERLQQVAGSFLTTTSHSDREKIEFIVGIDEGDKVFDSEESKERIRSIFPCYSVQFVKICPKMFGKVCRIWNHLARQASNDFIVLLGDDVELLDSGWKQDIERKFIEIKDNNPDLPFGAACVAFNDISFKGFPTFPVIHRFHLKTFRTLLPQQFINQGGDPYLYALYSRFNASSFSTSQLKNTLGGDSDARYLKHDINWKGQILTIKIRELEKKLSVPATGICLDVVVPSYRTNNKDILARILSLRCTDPIYVTFWVVVDNPDEKNLAEVKDLAEEFNGGLDGGNYFVNVIHYGENRGASYARNTGYNYSTADWVLFLDDDVIPEEPLLEAYAGSIMRYPKAKCMVGLTKLPEPCNIWTKILKTCNVMYFYGISKHRIHPPWGVTANIMVRGSRHNHAIQFKYLYPKTGGGEDIDFVFQLKHFYKTAGCVVSIPEAVVNHPWWNNGNTCYGQICGWANGDSQVITEWPEKSFLVFPNWIECILLLVLYYCLWLRETSDIPPLLRACGSIATIDHLVKIVAYYRPSKKLIEGSSNSIANFMVRIFLSFGASTVISAQEITRAFCLLKRFAFFSFARRMDWFDGQAAMEVREQKFRSGLQFILYCFVAYYFLQPSTMHTQCPLL